MTKSFRYLLANCCQTKALVAGPSLHHPIWNLNQLNLVIVDGTRPNPVHPNPVHPQKIDAGPKSGTVKVIRQTKYFLEIILTFNVTSFYELL